MATVTRAKPTDPGNDVLGGIPASYPHCIHALPGRWVYGATMEAPDVEIRRSLRRRRTVTAFRENGRIVVCLPSRLSKAEERRWVQVMLDRLAAQEKRRRPSDEGLLARAAELSRKYLDGRAKPSSVRWSATQRARWGSCTPTDGSIRLSGRLQGLPTWVIDYVLIHELTHLLVNDHGPEFWALVGRYPRAERARGFLDGYSHAAGAAAEDDGEDTVDGIDEDDLTDD